MSDWLFALAQPEMIAGITNRNLDHHPPATHRINTTEAEPTAQTSIGGSAAGTDLR